MLLIPFFYFLFFFQANNEPFIPDIAVAPTVPFTITSEGLIQVSTTGALDYETRQSYNFNVSIISRFHLLLN